MTDMKVELFYSRTCHVWKEAMENVCTAIAELGLKVPVCVSRIEDDREAAEKGFPGSPTVKINGRDVDPMFDKIKVFKANTCRVYMYGGECYEFPPKKLVLEALKNV